MKNALRKKGEVDRFVKHELSSCCNNDVKSLLKEIRDKLWVYNQ